jgi:hypothetical protein
MKPGQVTVNKDIRRQLPSPEYGETKKLLALSSNLFFFDQAGEILKRTIVSSFGIPWKTAARQLAVLQMILQTLAADAFSGTRFVAAVALLKIFFLLALHRSAPNTAQTPSLTSLQASLQRSLECRWQKAKSQQPRGKSQAPSCGHFNAPASPSSPLWRQSRAGYRTG